MSQCRVGSATSDQCDNEATVDPFRLGDGPILCEPHFRDHELSNAECEWKITREYLEGFAKIAQAVNIQPLDDIIDMAWAECEMRLSVLGAERRMVWE